MNKEERKELISVVFFPLYFVGLLWLSKFTEFVFGLDFTPYGVYPRTVSGLRGILASPFIHKDLEHLASNTVPLIILGCGIFYFYRPMAYRIYFWVYLLSGIGTWLIGRPSYHIGASGMVYGFASFIFFSGMLRRDIRLMAISLLVVFLYGSLIWYIFPFKTEISWEGHLMGGIGGLALAWIYRKKGPQRRVYEWENEPEEEDSGEPEPDEHGNIFGPGPDQYEWPVIRYIYKEGKDEQDKKTE